MCKEKSKDNKTNKKTSNRIFNLSKKILCQKNLKILRINKVKPRKPNSPIN